MAIQKLVSVRNVAIQDCEPCWVLDGLYLGMLLTLHALVFGSVLLSCFCPIQIGSASCVNMLCLMPYTTAQVHQAAQPKPLYHETGSVVHAGSIGSARNLEGLKKRGVTHILNASPIVPRFHKRHFSYMTVHVYDDAEEDIARFFHQAACFIARVCGFAPLSTPKIPRLYGSECLAGAVSP